MTGEGWRYFATRLDGRGGEQLLAEGLPLSGVQLTWALSSVDEIRATVPVEVEALRGKSASGSVFVPYETAVYATLDGRIRAGGIVTEADADGPSLALQCKGFRGYLTGRPFRGEKSYVGADSFDIAADVWADVQGTKGADLGLRLVKERAKSGITVGTPEPKDGDTASADEGPFLLNWWSTSDLGQTWDDLAERGKFDYVEQHTRVGDTVRHELRLGSPTIGRRRTDLRFAVGENVVGMPVVEGNGEDYADEVIVLGAGEGRDMVRGSWRLPSDRLHRPKIITDKGITSRAAANKRAESIGRALLDEADVKTVVLRNHPNAPLGSWGLGDTITILGNGTGWAGDLKMPVRVLSYTIDPATSDNATVTVTRAGRLES